LKNNNKKQQQKKQPKSTTDHLHAIDLSIMNQK